MDHHDHYRCFLVKTEAGPGEAPLVLRLRRSVDAGTAREPARPVAPGYNGTPLKALLKDIARRRGRSFP